MTLVNITLTEDEQELLLRCDVINQVYPRSGENVNRPLWKSIAEKISKAQNTKMFEFYPPNEG